MDDSGSPKSHPPPVQPANSPSTRKVRIQEDPTPYRTIELGEEVTITRFHQGTWPQELINKKIIGTNIHWTAYPWVRILRDKQPKRHIYPLKESTSIKRPNSYAALQKSDMKM